MRLGQMWGCVVRSYVIEHNCVSAAWRLTRAWSFSCAVGTTSEATSDNALTGRTQETFL